MRGTVGRLIAATSPPTTAAPMLASAWSSSRSQLAAHSDFALSSTEQVGTNHRKGRLLASEFLNNVGDGIVAYYQLFIDVP